MKVNILVGSADWHWIGGRLARELANRLPKFGVEATINDAGPADLHYEQIVYGEPTRRPCVGMFTHGDFRPKRFGPLYDGAVALNSVMFEYLNEAKSPNAWLIKLPVGDQFRRKEPIVFGVAGRTYSDGRKGEALVAKMVELGFTFRAWGSGWPCPTVGDDLAVLPRFYQDIDYYVDTSTDEGGCIPALEAMAMGKPVISHTVGVDRPVLAYERGSAASLLLVLRGLTRVRTYDDWAQDHAECFTQVLMGARVGA